MNDSAAPQERPVQPSHGHTGPQRLTADDGLLHAGRTSELARRAEQIAGHAHFGQVDKAGRPYIEHPARVAAALAPDDTDGRIVAWLHDVVEDTTQTLRTLRDAGFPDHILSAVEAITRLEGEPPADYYARVRANSIALRVKRADLADNSDPARLALLDDDTRQRLVQKYKKARAALAI